MMGRIFPVRGYIIYQSKTINKFPHVDTKKEEKRNASPPKEL